MPEIDVLGLDKLCENFQGILRDAPNIQREYHEKMSSKLTNLVRRNIPYRTGQVRRWQNAHVGSGGGYIAVRPDSVPSGKNGAYAITWYLEHGHKIRNNGLESIRQTRKQAKIRAVAGNNWVRGYSFYDTAETLAVPVAEMAARQFAAEIAYRLKR